MPGIDIIVGGHDHDPFTLFQGKTFIHKSGQNAYWLGRLDFTIKKIVSEDSRKIEIIHDWKMIANVNTTPDTSCKELVWYFYVQVF